MTAPSPRFESQVVAAFRAAIERYCNRMNAAGADEATLRITITVTTAVEHVNLRQRVHRLANQFVDAQLPGARVGSISFPVDAALTDPGYRIVIEPPAPGTDPRARPPAGPATRVDDLPPGEPLVLPTWDVDTLWLTLRYGDLEWRYPIAAAAGWVPFGRWPGQDSRELAVRLPDHATFVPRGELLRVRYYERRLEFRRGLVRPHYTVRLDGAPLPLPRDRHDEPPGAAARGSGRIEYEVGGQPPTVLNYLTAWGG